MEHTATYSPEDNKLRLYPAYRLPKDEYDRVKAHGFIWAPKQELFVALAWSPSREDFLLEMCEEIGDEDTSLVDRAEAKAERLENLSERKAAEASRAHDQVSRICDGIPLGQPILVGHHSEKHARKDAERIQNGMRKAVDCWKASEYWTYRAAGALRNAKYKERPDVRARRIKVIEADYRKSDKTLLEVREQIKQWKFEPLTWAYCKRITNYHHASFCFPLDKYPRVEGASKYEGDMGLWSALGDTMDTGIITPEQARDLALPRLERHIPILQRWIAHYENRIAYERAMLDEGGGLIAEKHELQVGGRVLIGQEWVTILKVNKKDGKQISVTTSRRYCKVCGIEEIKDYQAPTAEHAAKVVAALKIPPMCNYPGEGFASCTEAEWKKIPSDYRGSKVVKETETAGAHRIRHAIGVYLELPKPTTPEDQTKQWNRRHSYYGVFITDAKRKDPPQKELIAAPEPTADLFQARIDTEELIARTERLKASNDARDERNTAAAPFKALEDALKTGVRVVSAPQLFPTPKELAERMAGEADIEPMMRVLEPSAGTGVLISAIREFSKSAPVTAVEINLSLAQAIRDRFDIPVLSGDFLEQNGNLGKFDRIVMNPPFENGSDIKHIKHAAGFLADGGRLVALCANGPRQREILKPMAENSGGWWEDLPAGTFKEQGTGVNVALLLICNG